MFLPVRTVAPAALLTPAEAKAHLRVDHTDDDTFITALIEAATSYLDGWSGILGRALVAQTWRQDYDGFCDRMSLPLAPAVSITSVKYYDANDTEQTLASSVYRLRADALGPYVARIPGQAWPAVGDREAPVNVIYQAGFGTASQVPQGIRHAALLLIGHWYDNREAAASARDTPEEVPLAVSALIAPYRRIGV